VRNNELTGTLVAGDQRALCQVTDISGAGAKCVVTRGVPALRDERVELTLAQLTVAARVVRVEQLDATSDLLALQFVAAADPVEATVVQVMLRSLRVRSAAETVLVVDDEELIRSALSREMKRLGRAAMVVATAAEAVRAVQDDANGIAIVLVDLGLGESDGMDVVTYLAAEHPHLRRIVMSGQLFDALDSAVATGTAHAMLRKPWTQRSLKFALG